MTNKSGFIDVVRVSVADWVKLLRAIVLLVVFFFTLSTSIFALFDKLLNELGPSGLSWQNEQGTTITLGGTEKSITFPMYWCIHKDG